MKNTKESLQELGTDLMLAYGARNVVRTFQKARKMLDCIEKYEDSIDKIGITTEIEIKVLLKKIEEVKNKATSEK